MIEEGAQRSGRQLARETTSMTCFFIAGLLAAMSLHALAGWPGVGLLCSAILTGSGIALARYPADRI